MKTYVIYKVDLIDKDFEHPFWVKTVTASLFDVLRMVEMLNDDDPTHFYFYDEKEGH